MPIIALALVFTPVALTGVSAQEAACDGDNGGVDHALEQVTAPGRAFDHAPDKIIFAGNTVEDRNPEVPAGGCP